MNHMIKTVSLILFMLSAAVFYACSNQPVLPKSNAEITTAASAEHYVSSSIAQNSSASALDSSSLSSASAAESNLTDTASAVSSTASSTISHSEMRNIEEGTVSESSKASTDHAEICSLPENTAIQFYIPGDNFSESDLPDEEQEKIVLLIKIAEFYIDKNNLSAPNYIEFINFRGFTDALTDSGKDLFLQSLADIYSLKTCSVHSNDLENAGLVQSEFPYSIIKGATISLYEMTENEDGSVIFSIGDYVSAKGANDYHDCIIQKTNGQWEVIFEGTQTAA